MSSKLAAFTNNTQTFKNMQIILKANLDIRDSFIQTNMHIRIH